MKKIYPEFNQQARGAPLHPYEDINSGIFIDRYGATHDSNAEPRETRVRLGAFAAVYSRGHILLTNPPWAPSVAELPGGGVNAGEVLEEGLKRELIEETGIVLPEGRDIAPLKANEAYINLYAEDVNRYYRYIQKFYYYDVSDLIAPDAGQSSVVTAEGSRSFWHPVDRLDELTLRVGHEHIIRDAVKFFQSREQAPGIQGPCP